MPIARRSASSAIHHVMTETTAPLRELTEKLRQNEEQHDYLIELRHREHLKLMRVQRELAEAGG
jgi:hypothetical protein